MAVDTLWIVESDSAYREELCRCVENNTPLKAIEFTSCTAAVHETETRPPEFAVFAIDSPHCDDSALIEAFRKRLPNCKILLVASTIEVASSAHVLAIGVSGFVLKHMPVDYIVHSLQALKDGGLVLDPVMARWMVDQLPSGWLEKRIHTHYSLSEQQTQVLQLLAYGKLRKEISDQMGLSVHTIDSYLRRIYKKMGVNNKSAAVMAAFRANLIQWRSCA